MLIGHGWICGSPARAISQGDPAPFSLLTTASYIRSATARLIGRICEFAAREGFSEREIEVQMLYGIQRAEQDRLAREGHPMNVLISYGDYWYPWFVRRLAERPANVWFMVRNLFAR